MIKLKRGHPFGFTIAFLGVLALSTGAEAGHSHRSKKPHSPITAPGSPSGGTNNSVTNNSGPKNSSDALFENASGSPLLSTIKSAKQSIDIEIYTMADPTVGIEIKNAQARGVKVRIIQEPSPVGAACHVFNPPAAKDNAECTAGKQLVTDVISLGGEYIPFSKSLCGKPNSRCYQHGKILIADQTTALISTGNFDSTSLCDLANHPGNCDRDYTILTHRASVIQSLETVFENDFNGANSDFASLDPSLTVSPVSMTPLVDFIQSAQKSLLIENQYLEDPTLNQAIIDAAGRGVQVSIMVSSTCAFGKPKGSAVTKWQNIFTAFDQAGVKTNLFTGRMHVGGIKGYLHAKAMVVDGTRAWVGSVNGSTTAISDNREYGMFISDQTLVSTLNQYLSADFNNPLGESWQDSLNCAYDFVK